MIEIELTKGYKAKVCECHYNKIKDYKWCALVGKYQVKAVRGGKDDCGKSKTYYMHREIMDAPNGMEVDHIDGDNLNNQCNNLRICTKHENSRNVKISVRNTSGHKGVCWSKQANRWLARVAYDNHMYYLGVFKIKQDAMDAYNKKAKELHGDFFREC